MEETDFAVGCPIVNCGADIPTNCWVHYRIFNESEVALRRNEADKYVSTWQT